MPKHKHPFPNDELAFIVHKRLRGAGITLHRLVIRAVVHLVLEVLSEQLRPVVDAVLDRRRWLPRLRQDRMASRARLARKIAIERCRRISDADYGTLQFLLRTLEVRGDPAATALKRMIDASMMPALTRKKRRAAWAQPDDETES